MIDASFLSRRQSLAAIASTVVLAACGRGGRDGAVLKVGSQKGGTKALMLSSGALDGIAYHVEWSEFPAAQHLLEAVASGAIDMGLTGDPPFQFAYQSGAPIKAVSAQLTNPRPREALAIVVPRHSPARTLADLKGKSIATTRGSVGHYLALRALETAGLPPDHIRFVWLAPGDAKAAFDSGAIDAWSIWVPYLATAQRSGARIIADGYGLVQGYGFEVANETAIAGKKALLADFARREAKALDWAKRHLDEFSAVLAQETGLPLDIARITAGRSRRLPVALDDRLVADQQIVLQTFVKSGDIRAPRPLEAAFIDIQAD